MQTFTEVVIFFVFFSYVVDEITNDSKSIQAITPSIHSQIFCPLTFVFYDRMKHHLFRPREDEASCSH